MQAARRLIGLAGKLAARVKRGEDNLQRAFLRKARVRVDRDAAPVVGDAAGSVGVQLNLDPAGVARHRLVHRVVQHLGDEVVERAFIRAADIHAGALANRLQSLQHLNGGGVICFRCGVVCEEVLRGLGGGHWLFRICSFCCAY